MRKSHLLTTVAASAAMFAIAAPTAQAAEVADISDIDLVFGVSTVLSIEDIDVTDVAEDSLDASEQEQPTAVDSGDDSAEDEEFDDSLIVVTGSRISRPNLSSSVPINSFVNRELTDSGSLQIGDALNDLPAFRSTFSLANSGRFIGTVGLSLVDLRGLGTTRTLILVNGKRHVTSSPGIATRVDINNIPSDLIDRVDTVTGGNSSIYGSDAVAGVVNFVLKRDFDGIRARAQAGVSARGDAESYGAYVTAGTNFADERGNVVLALEFSNTRQIHNTDRDAQSGAFSGRTQFQLSTDRRGEDAAGDGVPDRTLETGIRNFNASEGGNYISSCPADDGTAFTARRREINCSGVFTLSGATEYGRPFVFAPNGDLIPNDGTRTFRPYGSSNNQNGLGSTLNLTGQLQPGIKRYLANMLARYEVSEAFQPFLDIKFVRTEARSEGQPVFHFNVFSIDNPFLNDQARELLSQSLAQGATQFGSLRFHVDFGGRGEDNNRNVFRVVAGAEGVFNDDWKYEIAFNYGRLDTFYSSRGNVIQQRYFNARNAVRNDAGQIVCGINADSDTSNDDSACVPANLFGFGAISQESLDYFSHTSTRDESASLFNATAFIAGDLSQLFEFPGGPISFSLGGEYRRETAFAGYDDVTSSGATFLNVIPDFAPPAQEVWEAYGELRFPLFADIAGVHELTVEAAGRLSNYKLGDIGTVYAYNIGGVYAPIEDIRIRVNYARSVRAPTQSDLHASLSQTFANGLVDPCSQLNINNGTSARPGNCMAAGVPTTQTFNGTTEPFTNIPSSGVRGLNGSNANLDVERGTSLTIGAVFQPSFLDGFSVSIDYYDITVTEAIATLTGQTIIDQCYDSTSGIDNAFCRAVNRNPNGTFMGQSDVEHAGTTVDLRVNGMTVGNAFTAGPFNFAKFEASGIDLDLNYERTFGEIEARLNVRGTYVIKLNNFTDINRPDFIDQQLLELGDPQWEGRVRLDVDFGKFDMAYTFRFIGRMTTAAYENAHSVQGRPPEDLDSHEFVYYPIITYSNFIFGYDLDDRFRVYAGVDNLFDELPPFGLSGAGAGSAIYDNIGRKFYFGVQAEFRHDFDTDGTESTDWSEICR